MKLGGYEFSNIGLVWCVTVCVGVIALVVVLCCLYRFAKSLESLSDNPVPVWKCPIASKSNSSVWSVSQRQFARNKGDVYLSIIIPCYNEEKRILETLETTIRCFEEISTDSVNTSFTYEMIIVDDGSTDKTIQVVSEFIEYKGFESKTNIFKLTANCGKGAAVKEGLLRSRGALCLIMDADGATEISEFKSLHNRLVVDMSTLSNMTSKIERRLSSHPQIVVGSRAHLEAESIAKRSLYRTVLMHGFHLFVWIVTITPIKDTQCGFKLFTRAAVADIFPHVKIRRWCFDVEVLLLAKKQEIKVLEVPVKWEEIAGSKVKFYHILHMIWELSAIFLGYTFFTSWKVWKHVKTE